MTAGGHNRLSDTVRTNAMRLAKQGYTAREISHKLHIPMSTVRAWIQPRREDKPELPEGLKLLHAWPSGTAIVFDEGSTE